MSGEREHPGESMSGDEDWSRDHVEGAALAAPPLVNNTTIKSSWDWTTGIVDDQVQ